MRLADAGRTEAKDYLGISHSDEAAERRSRSGAAITFNLRRTKQLEKEAVRAPVQRFARRCPPLAIVEFGGANSRCASSATHNAMKTNIVIGPLNTFRGSILVEVKSFVKFCKRLPIKKMARVSVIARAQREFHGVIARRDTCNFAICVCLDINESYGEVGSYVDQFRNSIEACAVGYVQHTAPVCAQGSHKIRSRGITNCFR